MKNPEPSPPIAAHTPGPWRGSHSALLTHNHPVQRWECRVHTARELETVGTAAHELEIVGTACGATPEEARARASLFAAAPDLLTALKAITDACEADCGGPTTDSFADDESVGAGAIDMALTFGMMRRARAAIALAEGR